MSGTRLCRQSCDEANYCSRSYLTHTTEALSLSSLIIYSVVDGRRYMRGRILLFSRYTKNAVHARGKDALMCYLIQAFFVLFHF